MTYSLSSIDGIDDAAAAALKSAGVRTAEKLLEAAKDIRGRKALAAKTGIDEKCLLQWANMADRMRIKGMGKAQAELLREAGVNTVRELKFRNGAKLARAVAAANAKRKLVKIAPSERVVNRWIEQAKKLPLKISY